MSRRRLSHSASPFIGLTLVALVVAHNLDYVRAYGSDGNLMLARTGHGEGWAVAVGLVLAGAALFLAVTVWNLLRLRRLAVRIVTAGDAVGPTDRQAFGAHLIRLWIGLCTSTTALFVLQENAEHAGVSGSLPGLDIIGDPGTVLVIGGVTLLAAVVGLLLRWEHERLVAQLAAGPRSALPRVRATSPWAACDVDRRPESLVGMRLAGRAPPSVSAA